jgi:hypothetical protein
MQLRYLKNIQEVQDGAAKECRLFMIMFIIIRVLKLVRFTKIQHVSP